MSKIRAIIIILSMILIIFKVILNSMIILMEIYEVKLKMKIKYRIYKWKIRRILENYGITRELADEISKNIFEEEYKMVNSLLSLRGLMKIFRSEHIYMR